MKKKRHEIELEDLKDIKFFDKKIMVKNELRNKYYIY